MKYIYKNRDRINEIIIRIFIIKKINNEYCKYITKLYNNYIKYMQKDSYNSNFSDVLRKNIDNYSKFELENDKVVFSSNLIKSIENIDIPNNTVILYFSNEYDSTLNKVIVQGKHGINIIGIVNNHEKIKTSIKTNTIIYCSIKNIKSIIKKYKPENIFIVLDINMIDRINNWYTILKEKIEGVFKELLTYSYKEIFESPSEISQKSIMTIESYKIKHNESKEKIKLERFIKKLCIIKDVCTKNSLKFGIEHKSNRIIMNITNVEEVNSNKVILLELMKLVETSLLEEKLAIKSYIYDTICDYIDNDVNMYNYCDFENNKCIAQRDKYNTTDYPKSKVNGCCYDLKTLKECKNLNDKKCMTRCISCKLFTCRYLKNRGIDYNINNNYQIKCFISRIYRPQFVWNFFKNKENIVK